MDKFLLEILLINIQAMVRRLINSINLSNIEAYER